MSLVRLAGIFIITFLLTACGGNISSDIVGEWQSDNGVQDLQFMTSGASVITDHKTQRQYQGQCQFSGTTMNCQYETFKYPIIMEVAISGDQLTLTSKSGRTESYRRKD